MMDVRPATGLGLYEPSAVRALGTKAPAGSMEALARALRLWKKGKNEAALRALDEVSALGVDCGAVRWIRAYALHDLGRAREASEAAHSAMEIFSELAPEPLLGPAVRKESICHDVSEKTLTVLGRALDEGRDPVWLLALRAGTLREPAFNRYAEAAADLRRAVELAPKRGWVWAHLGRALDGIGDSRGAADALDRAIVLSPRSGWMKAWRGQYRMRRGLPGALADLDAAKTLDPSYPFTRAWRGGALRQAGRLADAEKELRIGMTILPGYEWTHAELCLTLKALGRAEAAKAAADAYERDPKRGWCRRDEPEARAAGLAELARVRRKAPGDPYVRAWEAWILLGARDVRGALSALGSARAGEPAFLSAVRGEAALHAGDSAGARRFFDRAVATKRMAPYLGSRGLARLEAGDARGARADLSEAVARYSATAPYIKGLAGALAALGRLPEALETIERTLRLAPHDVEAHARKAEILYLSGRPDDAIACLIAAGWRAPTPLPGASRRAKAWRAAWRGADLRSRGLLAEALVALAEAARLDPAAPWTRAWLGECLLAAGRPETALPDFAAALRAAPRFALARQWRGEALLRLGRAKPALADFRAVRRLDPSYERAALGEAAALEVLG